MTAPHEPHDPTAELGSTQQFKAFVQHNDAPDEARARAAEDPDGPRAESDTDPAAAPATPSTRSAATTEAEVDRFGALIA